MTEAMQRPIPTKASKHVIHGFAEEVARKLEIGPGHPLQSVVAGLGGRLAYSSPLAAANAAPPSIEVASFNHFVIYVPSTTSTQRDRVTIAHELGHLFLHYPMVRAARPGALMVATRWVDQSDSVQERAEWEANWFAAGFLMAEKEFREVFHRYEGDTAKVAAFFDVSEQAAKVRAKTFSFI